MSATRIIAPPAPIELNLDAAFSFERGFGRAELYALAPRLDEVRQVLATDNSAGSPQALLAEYMTTRRRSLLGQILWAAKPLRDAADRVVVLGPPAIIDSANALRAACCHPHHNELSRGQRGGRPRVYLLPAVPDNDAVQGLLDILPHGRLLQNVDERWGLVALDDDGPNPLALGLFGVVWDALQSTTVPNEERKSAAAIGPNGSPLMTLAGQIEIPAIAFDGNALAANGRSRAFDPCVLAAGALLGFDIVKLLRGAAFMYQRFVSGAPGNNPPLDLAGLSYLLHQRGIDGHSVSTITAAMEPLARLLSKPNNSASELRIQCLPQAVRNDRLRVTMPVGNADGKKRRERLLNDVLIEEAQAERERRAAAGMPTAVIHMPSADEASLGQLVEMFSLADGVEERLRADT